MIFATALLISLSCVAAATSFNGILGAIRYDQLLRRLQNIERMELDE